MCMKMSAYIGFPPPRAAGTAPHQRIPCASCIYASCPTIGSLPHDDIADGDRIITNQRCRNDEQLSRERLTLRTPRRRIATTLDQMWKKSHRKKLYRRCTVTDAGSRCSNKTQHCRECPKHYDVRSKFDKLFDADVLCQRKQSTLTILESTPDANRF
jgi:hypothetical protein